MAPRPITALIVLSLLAAANAATVTIKIPFGPTGVPSVTDAPLQAGFKDKVLKAFADGLSFIVSNGLVSSGLTAPAPPVSLIPLPIWTFDTTTSPQTATVVFTYTDTWGIPLIFFTANTQYLYSNGKNAGTSLVSQYGALATGTTISLGTPVSPTPTPVSAPPPPFNARSPPPNISPPSPPRPPLPPNPVPLNVSSLLAEGSVSGNQIPDPSNTLARGVFEATVASSIALELNKASGVQGVQGAPVLATFNYTLVPASTATGRRLQQSNAPVTAPPGFVWVATYQIIWNNVPLITLTVFSQQGNAIANAVSVTVTVALSYTGLVTVIILNQVTIIIGPGGTVIIVDITNPVPGYGATGSAGKRRLIERRATGAAAKALAPATWADAEPADIAYGTDKSLFEIFNSPVDYYTAGAACASRGAQLASYKSEGAQIFIDILCDGSTSSQCWVEGNVAGACSAVSSSSINQLACTKKMPFICFKEQGKAIKATVVKESVEELSAVKPADVAFDSKHTMFEVMPSTTDYFTAASVCLARGAELANYESEAAQVFIDVLCENVAGQSCWVQGADNGKCSSVHLSEVHATACNKRQAFVCSKPAMKVKG